jgi:hypothetical protein
LILNLAPLPCGESENIDLGRMKLKQD